MTEFPETITFSDGAVLRRIGVESMGPLLFVDYRGDKAPDGHVRSAHLYARHPRAWTPTEIRGVEELDRRGLMWRDMAQLYAKLLETEP